MKKILTLIFILTLALCQAGWMSPQVANMGGPDYCECLSWPILTAPDFTYDADHANNDLYSCISGATESGDVDTALATPGTVSPGSGGQAIDANAGTIQFDNSTGYIDVEKGELRCSIWITTDGASGTVFVYMGDSNDVIRLWVDSTESVYVTATGGGLTASSTGIDISSTLNTYWVDVYVQWDDSRAAADQVTTNARIQDGTPTWIGWSNSTDADDFDCNPANQPGANEVDFGACTSELHDVIIDDIEINNTLPNGWEPAL